MILHLGGLCMEFRTQFHDLKLPSRSFLVQSHFPIFLLVFMQHIYGKDLPEDHPYYRSASPAYKTYLGKCGLTTFTNPDGNHGWVKDAFGLIQLAKLERTKEPPSIESLRKAGFKRGFVIWIPACREDIPEGWKKLYLHSHFMMTGFSRLHHENYMACWNTRAKRALKKYHAFQEQEPGLEIQSVSRDEFADAFKKAKITHIGKKEFVRYYQKMYDIDPSKVRSWIGYRKWVPVAGLAVHDYCNSSVHLVAFTNPAAKETQIGTGLIDIWFSDSVRLGIEYINFDHLRDKMMTRDQQGYTDFKKNFMEYLVEYPMGYFRWIGTGDAE